MALYSTVGSVFLEAENSMTNGALFNSTSTTTSLPFPDVADSSDAPLTPNNWTADLTTEYIIRNILSAFMVMINLLVLVTLGSTASLRTAANLVIGSLAVTDLLVGLLQPVGMLIEMELLISPVMCRLGYATVLAFCSVSINHLGFVSLDRYLLISKPLRYQSLITKRRVWIFIGGCWAWGGALFASFILGLSSQLDWNGRCRAELMYRLWFMVFLVLFQFLLPFFIMLFVHVNIFIVARHHQKAVQNSFRTSATDSQGVQAEEENGRKLSVGSSRARFRAARLLALPCGYFYLSWGPWFGVTLWAVSTGRMVQPHILERFVQMLGILNSLGNPILYAVSQPVLGKAMLVKLMALGNACKRCCARTYMGKPFETIDLVKALPAASESTPV